MKKMIKKITLLCLTACALSACSGKISADADGLIQVEDLLKSKFGEDAYYTAIHITNVMSYGLQLNVTVTEEPESYKLQEWNYVHGAWSQDSEVTIEISGGGKPTDFMYDLNGKVNFKDMGQFLDDSLEKLEDEKDFTPVLSAMNIDSPNDGDQSKMEYRLFLQPEHGGTDFVYVKNLSTGEVESHY